MIARGCPRVPRLKTSGTSAKQCLICWEIKDHKLGRVQFDLCIDSKTTRCKGNKIDNKMSRSQVQSKASIDYSTVHTHISNIDYRSKCFQKVKRQKQRCGSRYYASNDGTVDPT